MRRDSFSGPFLDAAYDLHLQLYPQPTLVWWHQNRDRDCHLETLIINFIRTLPTFIRTCTDECGNPIP